MTSDLDGFLWQCVEEMERRAALATDKREILEQGAAAFRSAMESAAPIDCELSTTPVVEHLPAGHPARSVPWVPTPRLEADDGTLVALGLVDKVLDLGDLICGLMLLAPGAAYPEHSHPPQEIYLPLTGEGQWRYGGSEEYVGLAPDAVVYNPPGGRHGTIAGTDPLLALYILWS